MRTGRIPFIGGEPPKPPKRTIDRSKPKVRLDGTPAEDCVPCRSKKANQPAKQ